MSTTDLLFKATVSFLGVATICTGAWLGENMPLTSRPRREPQAVLRPPAAGLNMYAGFEFHRKHPNTQLGAAQGQEAQAVAAEAEKQ